MSFAIRRNVKSFSDINHNFHVLDWLLRGNLDTDNVREISSVKITGVLEAEEIIIGANTAFEEGYDYRGKLTYLNSQGIYTGRIYANQIELGGIEEDDTGTTVIQGGYLNTQVIEAGTITTEKLAAGSVTADKISVNNLLEITTHLGGGGVILSSDGISVYDEFQNLRVHIGRIVT